MMEEEEEEEEEDEGLCSTGVVSEVSHKQDGGLSQYMSVLQVWPSTQE